MISHRMCAARWSRRLAGSGGTPSYHLAVRHHVQCMQESPAVAPIVQRLHPTARGDGRPNEQPDGRDLYDAIWVKHAIARLKPAYRDMAVLVASQQLTHAEAAVILGVTESTVAWRIHEVRRKFPLCTPQFASCAQLRNGRFSPLPARNPLARWST